MSKHKSNKNDSVLSVNTSAPVVDVVDASAPVVDASAPVVDVVDASAPVVDASAPVVDASAPVVDASAPVDAIDPRQDALRVLDAEIKLLQKEGSEAFLSGNGAEATRLGGILSALRSKRIDLSLDIGVEGTIVECREALSVVNFPEGRFHLVIEIEGGQIRSLSRLAISSGPATIAKVVAQSVEHKQASTTRAAFKATSTDPRHPPSGWSRSWTAKKVDYLVTSLGGGQYRITDKVNGTVVEGSGNELAKAASGNSLNIFAAWGLGIPGEAFDPSSSTKWTAPAPVKAPEAPATEPAT